MTTIYYIEHVLHSGGDYIAESVTFGSEADARAFLAKYAITAYQITKEEVTLDYRKVITERISKEVIAETAEYREMIQLC